MAEPVMKPEFPLFPHKLWRPNPEFLAGSLKKQDPWRRRDFWRYNKFFSPKNRLSRVFPGLLNGMILVGLYIMYDKAFNGESEKKSAH